MEGRGKGDSTDHNRWPWDTYANTRIFMYVRTSGARSAATPLMSPRLFSKLPGSTTLPTGAQLSYDSGGGASRPAVTARPSVVLPRSSAVRRMAGAPKPVVDRTARPDILQR